MTETDAHTKALSHDLPDPEGARLFYERLVAEHPRATKLLARDTALLSDVLALAAWSSLLSTTLGQHPDYLSWLARERVQTRVKTREELEESLARFALTHSQVDAQVVLARFRRRELLRIYLHDVRRAVTLVETTEELSNLADAVLQYALGLAQQELDNLYGSPQCTDARGRTATASTSIVALGKLGSRELNYASDIDLLFIYSDDGMTAGTGVRDPVTNREYFGRLAERVARLVGQPTGEGAAYRVDLRLRPYGRDGALSCSLAEAVRYYREKAQAWELQALIRSRAAAGSATLYARFADEVRERVYRREETVARALSHVRLARQKIDRHHRRDTGGFNVKLGRGGIREIEFIAQALQIAYGGRDEWLRAPHTLISLGRLHDRGFITEREHSTLSDAYVFLRMLEHRVQMEDGLQTHIVPEDARRRALLARRMHFDEPDALTSFNRALDMHTAHVRAVYERVFGTTESANSHEETGVEKDESEVTGNVGVKTGSVAARAKHTEREAENVEKDTWNVEKKANQEEANEAVNKAAKEAPNVEATQWGASLERMKEPPVDAETAASVAAASLLASRVSGLEGETEAERVESLSRILREKARDSLNRRRALSMLARIAASLDKSDVPLELSVGNLDALIRMCGASEFFGEMLASNPLHVPALTAASKTTVAECDYRALLRAAIDRERNFGGDLAALRRTWTHLLIELGACDTRGEIALRESNQMQTALAAASLNAGYLIARRELARRYGRLAAGPRLSVLGLGRLGSGGTDYGSDLDIVLIYDELVPSPVAALTREEAYARLAEILVTSLSSLTRDGYLYRVDMRLRPDGKNGAAATSSRAFVNYLRERAGVWEWLAYVKLRAVAGDLELGTLIEQQARRVIHQAAQQVGAETLRAETRRVRERLELERTRRASRAIDIKYGRGGMLDVYFATRFLQLRDNVPDDTDDRSTQATLTRLYAAGSLRHQDHDALVHGYTLLRTLDHYLRLLIGRSTRLPAEDHPALQDLARCAGYPSAHTLTNQLSIHMHAIHAAYQRITTQT
ncbi:MAG TPA: hypothetical protein VF666_14160 [Pyrinomonadaceae bacterium]